MTLFEREVRRTAMLTHPNVDFGLVKDVGGEAATSATLTSADSITGTPHYMAPEAISAPDTVARAQRAAEWGPCTAISCAQRKPAPKEPIDADAPHLVVTRIPA